MGIISALFPKTANTIEAQQAPQVINDRFASFTGLTTTPVNRDSALSVPAIARCHALITGVIGSMELQLESKATGEYLPTPLWMEQPSKSQPRAVTIALTVSDLMMYGQSFWQVTEVFADDGRPARFEWIENKRVGAVLNDIGTFVDYYTVNAYPVPNDGLGSLITFQSLGDSGILRRGASTIQAAIDVEKAASIAASTPMPTGILRNSGADLGEAEVQGILAAWKAARNNRSTAFLSAQLEYQPTAFSPKDMQYQDAIQTLALQCARMCNVPAQYLSADFTGNSMTYQNVQDERRQFVDLTLMPYIEAISSRLSMDDITPRTQYVEFDFSGFLRTDPMERLNVIEKMLSLELITLEQAREMENLSPNGSE